MKEKFKTFILFIAWVLFSIVGCTPQNIDEIPTVRPTSSAALPSTLSTQNDTLKKCRIIEELFNLG